MDIERFDKLSGQFLLATPCLKNFSFRDCVILVCHHDDDGSMGLVINRLQSDIYLDDILSEMNLSLPYNKRRYSKHNTYSGGPVESGRGFLLHDGDDLNNYEASVCISDNLHLTTSRDILEDIANDTGPHNFLLALGYTGWTSGQLKQELDNNSWMVTPANHDILFRTPVLDRWRCSAQQLGIDKALLSHQIGHA
ncbi:MAG: YqgE/AlgH family protein [Mariprofundales bacterium]